VSEHVEENALRSPNVVLNALWEEINKDHEDSEQKMLRSEQLSYCVLKTVEVPGP
jgi:hypothetical protein